MPGNDMEALLQRRIPALEPRSIDQIAAAAWCQCSSRWRRRKDRRIEPVAVGPELLRHVRNAGRSPELAARTRAHSGVIGPVRHAEGLAGLRLGGARKLPVAERAFHKT